MAVHVDALKFADNYPEVGRIPILPGRLQIRLGMGTHVDIVSMYVVRGIDAVIFRSAQTDGWRSHANVICGPERVTHLTVLVPEQYDGEVMINHE